MTTPSFKRAIRGYDSSETDAIVADLLARREELSVEIGDLAREVQRVSRELADIKRNKPSFGELGSAFEETLRLAETQAEKMVLDARNEAEFIFSQARLRVRDLEESSERDAAQIRSAAESLVEEAKIKTDREVALERQRAADERVKIESISARAERAVSAMLGESERQIAQLRSDAQRSSQELIDEANEIIRTIGELRSDVMNRIQDELSEAQTNATAVHDDATRYAEQAHQQADLYVQTAIERAAESARGADEHLQSARERVTEIIDDAKAYADRLMSQAVSRASEISTETEALLNSFALDAEGRINDARRAKSELADFTHRQRIITNTLGAKRNRAVAAADSAPKAEPTSKEGDD